MTRVKPTKTLAPKKRVSSKALKEHDRAVSCSYRALTRFLFPGRNLKAKVAAWAKGTTEEELFIAFLKVLGFKRNKKNLPDPFKKQYLLEISPEGEKDIRLYSLSGGPMLVFDAKGKFKEWC
jgi:hypothetical protein